MNTTKAKLFNETGNNGGALNQASQLQKTMQEKQDQEKMYENLNRVTENQKSAKRVAKNKNIIHNLLDTLNKSPKFSKMVEYCMHCIKNIAIDDSSIQELIDEGVLETVLKVQRLNPYNENVTKVVSEVISSLSNNEETARIVASKIGTSTLMFSLRKHVDPLVLSSTLKATTNLMQAKENISLFIKEDILSVLEHICRVVPQEPQVLAQVANCTNSLTTITGYTKPIIQSNVVHLLVDNVTSYPACTPLVKNTLNLLTNVSSNDQNSIKVFRNTNTMDAIVQATEINYNNKEIINLATKALRTYSTDEDIFSTLKSNVTISPQFAESISKLSSLLLIEENVPKVIDNNGINLLLYAVKAASVEEPSEVSTKILVSSLRGLSRSCIDEKKIYSIMQAGGVTSFLNVLSTHTKNTEVTISALQAIGSMITRPENVEFLLRCNILQSIDNTLKVNSTSSNIAKACCDIYSKLSTYQICSDVLVTTDIVSNVSNFISKYPESTEQMHSCMNILYNLPNNQNILQRITEANIPQNIVSIALKNIDNEEIINDILQFYDWYMNDASKLKVLEQMNVSESILKIIDVYQDNKDIYDKATIINNKLTSDKIINTRIQNVTKLLSNISSQEPDNIYKLSESISTLSNLTLVPHNIQVLTSLNVNKIFNSSIIASLSLPESEERIQILTNSLNGISRIQELSTNNNKIQQQKQQDIMNVNILPQLFDVITDVSYESVAESFIKIVSRNLQNSPQNINILNTDTIQKLTNIGKLYKYNENILSDIANILNIISTKTELIPSIIDNDGCTVLADTLLTNIDKPKELLQTMSLVCKLAIDTKSSQELFDNGIYTSILRVLKKHIQDPVIVEASQKVITSLLVTEDIAQKMGKENIFDVIIPIIRGHYNIPSLIEVDIILLDSLSSASGNSTLLLKDEYAIIEQMNWVIHRYSDNPLTIEAAERLLSTLSNSIQSKVKISQQSDVENIQEIVNNNKLIDIANDIEKNKLDTEKLQPLFTKLDAMLDVPGSIKQTNNNNDTIQNQEQLSSSLPKVISNIISKNIDNEELFKKASKILIKLSSYQLEEGGNNEQDIYVDTDVLAAQVEQLKPHPNFKKVIPLEYQTETLSNLSKLDFNKQTLNKLISVGALSTILKQITETDDINLLTQATKVLDKFSSDRTAAQMIATGQFVSIRDLIDTLRNNIKNIELLKYGIQLLGNLAITDDLKNEIGIQSGIQLIVQVAIMYDTELELIHNCLQSLVALTYNNINNCAFVMASRGISMTIQYINLHLDNSDILKPSLYILYNMCYTSTCFREQVIQEDGAQAIVDTVLNNFEHIDVQLIAFRTLGILSSNGSNIDTIIKTGAVQGIIAGMTVLSDKQEVVEAAISVLRALALNSDPDQIRIMADEGAIQGQLEVLLQYSTDVDISLSCVTALCNLATQVYNSNIILKQGGGEIIVNSLKTLTYDVNYISMTLRLIYNLTYAYDNLEILLQTNVIKNVTYAMSQQMNSKEILIMGLRCISNLCYNTTLTKLVMQSNPIEFQLSLIENCNTDIILECLSCLCSIVRTESAAITISNQSCNSCIQLLKRLPNDHNVLLSLTKFLTNLFIFSDSGRIAMQTPIIKTWLNTITTNINDEEFMTIASRPIENLAFVDQEIRDKLKEIAIPVLKEVLEVHSDNEQIVSAARLGINTINFTDYSIQPLNTSEGNRVTRNIRDVYDTLGEKDTSQPQQVEDIPPKIRNFQTSGQQLIKHSRTAAPRPRHVYVTSDQKWLIWKDPKTTTIDDEQRMKIFKIRSVERGRCTEQQQRKRFGKYNADEKCAFSIQGRERTLDLEAANEKEREKWVHAIETLIAYKRNIQGLQNRTGRFE